MKAFLMFRNRDFDPQLLLSRRENERYARNIGQAMDLRQLHPWNAADLIRDLGLHILFDAMSLGDKFLHEIAETSLLSGVVDLDTILYRQHIFSDCLNNPQLVRQIYQMTIEAIEGEKRIIGAITASILPRFFTGQWTLWNSSWAY